MASSTPTRRVLSDLNVNTPTNRGAIQPSKLSANSPTKPQKVGEVSLQTALKRDISSAVREEAHLGSKKRAADIAMDATQSPFKRRKMIPSPNVACEEGPQISRHGKSREGSVDDGRVLQSSPSRQTIASNAQSSPSVSVSPASSFGSRRAGLDDSQNTTITEPDDVPLPATLFAPTFSRLISSALTKGEAREKAEVLRLRLKLASYKVRTNQIDIPIDRLQIKTLASMSPKLPYLPRTATNASQRRIPLPSIASTIPNIQLQKPSAERMRIRDTGVPSSPPPYLHIPKRQNKGPSNLMTEDESHPGESEGFNTSILQGQCQGLLNPPNLGSPTWNGNDLTSSVVKGRAADGLLSLMRQQN